MAATTISKKNIKFEQSYILGILVVFNLLTIFLMFLLRDRIPPQVPLFYGRPQGEGQLASRDFLILPSVFAIVIALLDFMAIRLSKDDFLEKIFLGINICLTSLAIIAIFKIFFLISHF